MPNTNSSFWPREEMLWSILIPSRRERMATNLPSGKKERIDPHGIGRIEDENERGIESLSVNQAKDKAVHNRSSVFWSSLLRSGVCHVIWRLEMDLVRARLVAALISSANIISFVTRQIGEGLRFTLNYDRTMWWLSRMILLHTDFQSWFQWFVDIDF